ncbi:MAG TPA: DUF4214 domain-containing protein [Noviherbaspirillum sp.]
MEKLLQNATDEDFLMHCYRTLFAREPDAEGMRHHLDALARGMSRTALVQAFVASDEFAGKFNGGITPTSAAAQSAFQRFAPEGHFYSPIPAREDFGTKYDTLVLDDIDAEMANERTQLALAAVFKRFYDELPFPADATDGFRYYLNNGAFNYFDGIMLYCFIRLLKPRRIIEVGSGFSSAAMIDTCERFLQAETAITFIEPYPETLHKCLRPGDETRYTVIEKKVQDVPLDVFQALGKDDILFIDSSHVAKFGSDVNHLLFKVIPQLQDGVVIHFHDIFRNFDYPPQWLNEGRAWNEGYLLRAFLMSNPDYRIQFFNDWFAHRHWDILERDMPLCTVQPHGSPFKNCGVSLWLRKGGDST